MPVYSMSIFNTLLQRMGMVPGQSVVIPGSQERGLDQQSNIGSARTTIETGMDTGSKQARD
ncbi:MAG: hypothetical protein B6D71_03475 [gamma proteobacterium symbiont of Stewartia floridana]|nr:MAG: hypothetical protein B6D71_03475 [gamma proteobacterium symbiont of Stewartia floridana]